MRRSLTGERAWHVYARGTRRLALFYEDRDYLKFLSLLQSALSESGCVLFGYCLMSNHYHLILRGTSKQLSECMWWLNHQYALYHNRKHQLGGHVFDGPYRAHRQKTVRGLFRRLAYVFLNPVATRLVEGPEQYRWSGYRSFMGITGSPLPVTMPEEMWFLGPTLEEARKAFGNRLNEQRQICPRKSKQAPSALEVNGEQCRWLLAEAQQRSAEFANEDPVTVALHWAQECGIPPRAMASVLGEPGPRRIRNLLYRFSKKLKCDPDLASRVGMP